jgi:hypothetical protein
MRITRERFEALLDGTAINVTGAERVVRIEAFNAQRRGEDPATAVESKMFNVSIVQPTSISASSPATNPVRQSEQPATDARDAVKHRLYLLGLIGVAAVVAWTAAYAGLGVIVAHFIAAAIGGLLIQGLVWFFRAPV